MGRLYVLIGKSASGKDAIYKRLLGKPGLFLKPFVGYTTRPIRSGEENGREYFFTDEEGLKKIEDSGRLIEKRVYHTVHGEWCYFTADSDTIDLSSQDYLYIGTLESYVSIRDYYGPDKVVPIYIQTEDGLRLKRALERERGQDVPRYAEMCRRFLADEEDFSEEKLKAANIGRRFDNDELDECIARICEMIELHG